MRKKQKKEKKPETSRDPHEIPDESRFPTKTTPRKKWARRNVGGFLKFPKVPSGFPRASLRLP